MSITGNGTQADGNASGGNVQPITLTQDDIAALTAARAVQLAAQHQHQHNASNLLTAFSSSHGGSSTTQTIPTAGDGSILTPRRDKVVDKQHKVDISGEVLHASDGWCIYSFEDFIGKFIYNNHNISSTSGSGTRHQRSFANI